MTMGRKNGIAKARRPKAKGDEKFKEADIKLARAKTTNIIGTDTFKLRQDKACAFNLLA